MLDAANYAKREWDKVTDETIKNGFIWVYLKISLESAVVETFDNNNFFDLNIRATEQAINEFVAINDQSSDLFQDDIIEESNFFLKKSKQ